VLVTGGASGLGAAVVAALNEREVPVGVLDLAAPAINVPSACVDLADGRAAERAVHELSRTMGGVGAVVTAAGIDACGSLLLPGGMATSFFDGRPDQYKPGPAAHLNPPNVVAEAVLFALSQPDGCVVRELMVCPDGEDSWP